MSIWRSDAPMGGRFVHEFHAKWCPPSVEAPVVAVVGASIRENSNATSSTFSISNLSIDPALRRHESNTKMQLSHLQDLILGQRDAMSPRATKGHSEES